MTDKISKKSLYTQNLSAPPTISFKNVTFKYGDAEKETLMDFSFEIEKGKVLALVGKSGYVILRKEPESRQYLI